MPWIYLLLAGLLEVVWAIGLKYTEGFTKLLPSIITILAMGVSFSLLSMALKSLPVGTAYATYTGVGTVGAVIVGMIWLGEPRDAARIACVTLIIAGIVGLKVVSK